MESERLNAELRNARQVVMDAPVGKAKDQLAIEGKDAQLADLRTQLEKGVAQNATLPDARLAAEMELVGARTARDSLQAENADLRKQIAAPRKRWAPYGGWRPRSRRCRPNAGRTSRRCLPGSPACLSLLPVPRAWLPRMDSVLQ
ncbi:hypothetical protein [Massilia aerilata]|uniref:Uncharacterized protein n=1 Tax=Massilia aerilata TaxID=453817 RepID=A0ABW0RRR9_9BURK